jgi:hypothetical protein
VDPIQPTPVAERHGYYVTPEITAGGFKVLGRPRGTVQTQDMGQYGGKWRDDDQLWWTGARPKSRLVLAIPVKKAGKYEVKAVMTKAVDYGIVQLYIDDKKAGEPIDLFNNGVIPTDPPVSLGTHDLTAGEHKLTVEIVGANPKAVKGYMFGLDYLIFDEQK